MNPTRLWSVIVLAGGAGQRLGGADKAGLLVNGTSALERLLGGLPAAMPVIVAGVERPTSRHVTFRQESPAGGGPVAGIAAALTEVATSNAVIVATDMPWCAPIITELMERFALLSADALVPVTIDGRQQMLCSAWRTAALRRTINELGDPQGQAVRILVALAAVDEWHLDARQSALLADIDTPDDLTRAQDEPPAVP